MGGAGSGEPDGPRIATLQPMTTRILICLALFLSGAASARPLVIEAPLEPPFIWNWVGYAGDELVSVNLDIDTDPNGVSTYIYSANLYRRGAGRRWSLNRTLATESGHEYIQRPRVAMNAGVAAFVMLSGLRIFERTNAGWQESPIDLPQRPQGQALDLDGDTILAVEGGCATRALALRRAANGHWVLAATLPVPAGTCVTDLDLDANAAIVRSVIDSVQAPSVRIFERAGGAWVVAADLISDESNPPYFGQAVAIHGALALVSGFDRGAHVYRRRNSGWVETGRFDNPDGREWRGDSNIQITDDYIVRVCDSDNRSTTIVCVYRQRADESFEHVANLVPNHNNGVSLAFISGSHVIALAGDFGNQPLVFDLPASFAVPALVQEDFESGPSSQWTPLPGSRFAIENNGTTHVYRQSSLVGDAGAIHAADMTNQSISADIRINTFDGNDRWVGLATRYIDAANHYYVTLRGSHQLILKRMLNGVYTEIGRASVHVTPGQSYRLALESSGSLHAVDIDGQRIIRAYDASHAHGRAGLRMYRAAADFDNLVVSPGPISNLVYAERETLGGTWTGIDRTFSQTTLRGDARRTTGLPREDTVVQATISVQQFAANGSPWVGLMTRYEDAGNYYYATVRKSNELSLRKLTNGAITVLGTVPMSIVPHQIFVLRLEAIGDRLRVFVNDELRLEHAGARIVAGKVGAMTYRTAASFNQYTAYEP
jgi:hypothetical protein